MSHIRSKPLCFFLHWLKLNRRRFTIQPGPILLRRRHYICFAFIGIQNVIRATLGLSGITISVEWRGDCWDFLEHFELYEEHGSMGWHCRICFEPVGNGVFPVLS